MKARLDVWMAITCLAAVCLPNSSPLIAQEPAPDAVEVITLATGLNRPCGVAVRPAAGRAGDEVFVAESGAMRIVAVSTTSDGEVTEVITGFPAAEVSLATLLKAGPLAIEFLSHNTIVTAGAGSEDSGQLLRAYELDDEQLPFDAGQVKTTAVLVENSEPAGALVALARSPASMFVAGDGGWVFQTSWKGTQLTPLKPFVNTAEATGIQGTHGVAVSEKGYLVVSQMGSTDASGDSVIAFHHPYDREQTNLLVLKPGLDDIVALAYSPATGDLYAADFAASDLDAGGIYRIDAAQDKETGKMSCEPKLIAKVAHPTAIAFGREGVMYVTAFGAPDGDSDATGVLLKVLPNSE